MLTLPTRPKVHPTYETMHCKSQEQRAQISSLRRNPDSEFPPSRVQRKRWVLEDPTGGHMNTPHTSQDREVEGQDEDGELSRTKGREIKGKEG